VYLDEGKIKVYAKDPNYEPSPMFHDSIFERAMDYLMMEEI
jgi:hypothetical protein